MNKPVESLPAEKLEYLRRRTDKYFSKSRQIVEKFGDRTVSYGVFLRRGVICAVNPAIDVLRSYYSAKTEPLRITRLYEEGAFVPDQKAIFTYTGSFAALVELETLILQRVGVACVSAYNAHKMAMNLKKVAFIDMHARHSPATTCRCSRPTVPRSAAEWRSSAAQSASSAPRRTLQLISTDRTKASAPCRTASSATPARPCAPRKCMSRPIPRTISR